tara:strand:+ start:564 stop:959 length:396 start_codon:yes stop_codon:yes gene_type:complete
MASQLKVDTITGVTTAGSVAVTGEGNSTTTNLQQGLVKMWSNVQTDQSTQDDSFNVSSVSDQGTGKSRRNLTNAFSANPFNNAGLSVEQQDNAGFSRFTSVSTSAVETNIRNSSNSNSDHMNNCLAAGDLA